MNAVIIPESRPVIGVSEETFHRFNASVPERQRGETLTRLMEEEIRRRDERLAAACEGANNDPETAALVADFQGFDTPIEEPWEDA